MFKRRTKTIKRRLKNGVPEENPQESDVEVLLPGLELSQLLQPNRMDSTMVVVLELMQQIFKLRKIRHNKV